MHVPQIRALYFTLQYHKGELRLYDVTFENAGMYQCIAENAYGSIYANAELKILGQYPFPISDKYLSSKQPIIRQEVIRSLCSISLYYD